MRRIQIKSICAAGLSVLLGESLQSCTDRYGETEPWSDTQAGIVCRTLADEEKNTGDLQTKLYIFTKGGNSGYQLIDSLPEVVSGSTRLKLNPADLRTKQYRFLFIATSANKPEIGVKSTDSSSLAFGTSWEKVAVSTIEDSLSVDNYYGISDLSGQAILQSGTIEGELKRLVGQMIFCFYKIDAQKKPVSLNDSTVLSVLDRISSIDITYKGVPRQVTFDAANKPVALAGDEGTLHHTIHFLQTEEGLKVNLPQPGIPVETADSIPGGAILKGACLLPSNQKIQVSMLFRYYDTTPVCGRTGTSHTHGVQCYTPRTLSLDIPKETDMLKLKVLPDHFTVNNAYLPCNRIIDILHTSGFEVHTKWNSNDLR